MKRTLLLTVAWFGSAAAAVGLGFLAVSLVNASASPVATGSTATSVTAGATSTSAAVPSPSPSATGDMATAAGTVYANCTGGSPVLAGVPVAGWQVDDSVDAGQVEFRSATQRLEVHVVCTGGSPRFAVEGPRADHSAAPTSKAPAAPTTSEHSGGGDSSGRGRGGHGSDDPAGDDSSGRGGGGHGSDG